MKNKIESCDKDNIKHRLEHENLNVYKSRHLSFCVCVYIYLMTDVCL